MILLQGKNIHLRALEQNDIDYLFTVENDENFWHLSHTQTPFSKTLLKQYLNNSHKDIYEAKQLRLVIATTTKPVGLIDLFDFDFKNHKAGIGIIIYKKNDRRKHYATEAIELLTNYCKTHLQLHQLYCNILEHNTSSLNLFKKQGFTTVGLKKDWNFHNNTYHNEYLLQKLLHVH